jgi:hypothetical protein
MKGLKLNIGDARQRHPAIILGLKQFRASTESGRFQAF